MITRLRSSRPLQAALCAIAAAVSASSALGSELIVLNNNDSGPGSLRQALAENTSLGGGNTILFSSAVNGAITLASAELLINANVTILGPGPGSLTINGNAAFRVLHISNGALAFLSGLSISNGAISGSFPGNIGGGIWNDSSTLALSNCLITHNYGGAGPAGGIYNDHSTLTLLNCTISANSTSGSGGGIENYGYAGSSTIASAGCTFSGNTAGGPGNVGGAIFNDGNNGSATLLITNSTFSGNAAQAGGAIYNTGASGIAQTLLAVRSGTFSDNSSAAGGSGSAIYNNGASATVRLGNTLLKAPVTQTSLVNSGGAFISDGFNLSSDTGGGVLTNSTDLRGADPMLGPLSNNGGPTLTQALLAGSPAIDKGNSFGLTTDQRGEIRPFDFPSIANTASGDGSDIGAFEVGRPPLSIQLLNNAAVLSWPSFYGPLMLQSSTSLILSNSWGAATGTPAIFGNQYWQTSAPISGIQFFRLRTN